VGFKHPWQKILPRHAEDPLVGYRKDGKLICSSGCSHDNNSWPCRSACLACAWVGLAVAKATLFPSGVLPVQEAQACPGG